VPGLFGVMSKDGRLSRRDLRSMALRMADSMRCVPWLHTDLWACDAFCGGRVHLGVLDPRPQPFRLGPESSRMWFDGEMFSEDGDAQVQMSYESISALISNPEELIEADGVFAVACYDARDQSLVLANDRLGLRPLYYMETLHWFAYAAEVKALLAICDRVPDLDEISLRQFFGFGYMLGERTWWEGIRLIPPGSLWRVTPKVRQDSRYWTFDSIVRDPLPEADALAEFGRLWSKAVRQRSRPGVMPLLLSGGLDSRLLLAELRAQRADLVTITFGDRYSTDVQLARKCSDIAGVEHRVLYITPQNWWHGREQAIWQTDGLMNARDLHVAIAANDMRLGACYSPMNFAGDLLFGGSYLAGLPQDWRLAPETLMSTKYVRNPFFRRDEVLAVSRPDIRAYAEGPSSDCFYILQRQRRATLTGPLTTMPFCEAGYPSLSYPLLRLLLSSLSDEQRAHSKFYNRFLIARHPQFFRDVPWQKTGRGLSETPLTRAWRDASIQGRRRLLRLAGRKPNPYYSFFVDYRQLVQSSGMLERFRSRSLLADDFLHGKGKKAIEAYEKSPLNTYALIALFTFETYLQQVANACPPTMEAANLAETLSC